MRDGFGRRGVPIVAWRDGDSLEAPLAALAVWRRQARGRARQMRSAERGSRSHLGGSLGRRSVRGGDPGPGPGDGAACSRGRVWPGSAAWSRSPPRSWEGAAARSRSASCSSAPPWSSARCTSRPAPVRACSRSRAPCCSAPPRSRIDRSATRGSLEYRPGARRWDPFWILGVAAASAGVSYAAVSARSLVAGGGPAALAAGTVAAVLVVVLARSALGARSGPAPMSRLTAADRLFRLPVASPALERQVLVQAARGRGRCAPAGRR